MSQKRAILDVVSRTTLTGSTFGWESLNDGIEGETTMAAPVGGTQSFANRRLRWTLVGSDAIGLASGWLVACSVGLNFAGPSWQLALFGMLLCAITLGIFFTSRLYLSRMCSVRALETAAILRACLLGGVAAWMVAGRFGITIVRARAVVLGEIVAVGFVVLGRAVYRKALKSHRGAGRLSRKVVLIGGGEEVYELHNLLSSEPELGYSVVGVIGDRQEMSRWADDLTYLGPLSEAVGATRSNGAHGAIVASSGLSIRDMNQVVRDLLVADLHVQLFGGLLGIDPSRLQMNPIGGEAAFYLEQARLTGLQSKLKRLFDIVVGGLALVVLSPIIGVFALLTKLTDGGTAFFHQQRIGRDGQPFTMIKIRTMVMNAEALQSQLVADNERHGPLFKLKDDPRLTRIGKFMDATSINELPQLWNVLRGDMSLVGPRPALASEVATFSDRLLMRNQVRPGVTGLWQVSGRDSASFATYERSDVFYVENWSTRLDLMILAQTAAHLVARVFHLPRVGAEVSSALPGGIGRGVDPDDFRVGPITVEQPVNAQTSPGFVTATTLRRNNSGQGVRRPFPASGVLTTQPRLMHAVDDAEASESA